jgi:hypothetical protein
MQTTAQDRAVSSLECPSRHSRTYGAPRPTLKGVNAVTFLIQSEPVLTRAVESGSETEAIFRWSR